MTPEPDVPEDPVQATDALAPEAADVARTTVTEATGGLEAATASAADAAQLVNQDGASAAATASRNSADAFGMARERLAAMAATLPPPAQDMLRPLRSSSEALGKGVETSYANAMEGMAEFNSKAIAAWRSNAESTIRHWQSLASVKSLSEAISLSAEHTRKQLEAVTTQTRELSALATRIVRDAADPLKITGR